MDRLDEIFHLQFHQQLDIRNPLDEDIDGYLTDMTTYLMHEVMDFLESRKYKKHHIKGVQLSRSTQIYELVDIQKYLISLALALSVTPDEWIEYFKSKTMVVADKWRQENTDLSGDIIVCDIDDVLTKFKEAQEELDFDNRQFIIEETSFYRDLQPKPESILAIQELFRRGYKIVLATSRKAFRSKVIEVHTIEWLHDYGVPYEMILWGHDKVENVKRLGIVPVCVIDNSAKHALDFADEGWTTYHFLTGEGMLGRLLDHNNVINIATLWHIRELRGTHAG